MCCCCWKCQLTLTKSFPYIKKSLDCWSGDQYWGITVIVHLYTRLKDHRQRIPRFVIRRYLEKSIQKKLFCRLQSLQIKTIFQEKTIINSISENLLSRFIYGLSLVPIALSSVGRKTEKMKCFYYYNYYYYNRTQHSKPLR